MEDSDKLDIFYKANASRPFYTETESDFNNYRGGYKTEVQVSESLFSMSLTKDAKVSKTINTKSSQLNSDYLDTHTINNQLINMHMDLIESDHLPQFGGGESSLSVPINFSATTNISPYIVNTADVNFSKSQNKNLSSQTKYSEYANAAKRYDNYDSVRDTYSNSGEYMTSQLDSLSTQTSNDYSPTRYSATSISEKYATKPTKPTKITKTAKPTKTTKTTKPKNSKSQASKSKIVKSKVRKSNTNKIKVVKRKVGKYKVVKRKVGKHKVVKRKAVKHKVVKRKAVKRKAVKHKAVKSKNNVARSSAKSATKSSTKSTRSSTRSTRSPVKSVTKPYIDSVISSVKSATRSTTSFNTPISSTKSENATSTRYDDISNQGQSQSQDGGKVNETTDIMDSGRYMNMYY